MVSRGLKIDKDMLDKDMQPVLEVLISDSEAEKSWSRLRQNYWMVRL